MTTNVYSRSELLCRGTDDSDIRAAIRDGHLVRLRRGWYATPEADPDTVAAVRAGGVLACVSALAAHGLWIPPGHDRLHIRFSRHGERAGRWGCHGYGSTLPCAAAVDTVPVALDCAGRCLGREDWIVVCDSALNSTGMSPTELRSQLPACAAHVGRWINDSDRRSQSGTESMVRLRLRALGYAVEVQPEIPGVGRVDLRVGRLLIECDSRAHHTGLDTYCTDRRRDRAALVGRWMTMRLTYSDVVSDWDAVLADIAAIVRRDRHRLRPGRKLPLGVH
ncbi:hypothetical protein [Williamsia sp. CHRR-6]|uniref:hypothetical protein n=1 Tax=Williamsia sp. CHRR-6 TaxID=2835871 RepID=UPI001BD9B68F|nr:hypothetical protein [Williamsia sp. CHRR-6]MBT0565994.1 hypothetical protein [Williamsia sp. CHRR-6]